MNMISEFLKKKRFQWQLRKKDTTKQMVPISQVMEKGKRERRGKLSGIKEWKTWKTESSWFESGWEII